MRKRMIVKRRWMIVDIFERIECFVVCRIAKIEERNIYWIVKKTSRLYWEEMREVLQLETLKKRKHDFQIESSRLMLGTLLSWKRDSWLVANMISRSQICPWTRCWLTSIGVVSPHLPDRSTRLKMKKVDSRLFSMLSPCVSLFVENKILNSFVFLLCLSERNQLDNNVKNQLLVVINIRCQRTRGKIAPCFCFFGQLFLEKWGLKIKKKKKRLSSFSV